MTTILMVPVRLDALYLKNDFSVIASMTDFSRLPFSDGTQYINPDVANISELLLSQPFQDRVLILKTGIHLHWALPSALARASEDDFQNVQFPAAPNRWLITRRGSDIPDQQWVVESDYLAPDESFGGVAYPVRPSATSLQPFSYIGRTLDITKWLPIDSTASYLEQLTAVGYGEPAFAAFYPNCRSVFGFYDAAPPKNLKDLKYDVVGWYSDNKKDPLQLKGFADAAVAVGQRLGKPTTDLQVQYQALAELYQWSVPAAQQTGAFPSQIACFAQIRFGPSGAPPAPYLPEKEVDIAIGNSSTEALSAYLASQESDRGQARALEEQLEALYLARKLDALQFDIDSRFKQGRHDKEFSPIPGGILWAIRAESPDYTPAVEEPEPEEATRSSLPRALAAPLDHLNRLQQAYNRDNAELESLRSQTFADWYKYMLRAYPPLGVEDSAPNADEIRFFIEQYDLKTLESRVQANKALRAELQSAFDATAQKVAELQLLEPSDVNDPQTAVRLMALYTYPLPTDVPSLSDQLKADIVATVNRLPSSLIVPIKQQPDFTPTVEMQLLEDKIRIVGLHGDSKELDWVWMRYQRLLLEFLCPNLPKEPSYVLTSIPAPRFYQPNEPVILLAGMDTTLKITDRYGQAGPLTCDVKSSLTDVIELSLGQFGGIIDDLYKANSERDCFSLWADQPWHPFMLEWEVEFLPIGGKSLPEDGGAYYPNCIQNNCQLEENEVDLSLLSGKATLTVEDNHYHGRSILTPHARVRLIEQIDAYLEGQLLPAYYQANSDKAGKAMPTHFTDDDNRKEVLDWYQSQISNTLDSNVLKMVEVAESIGADFHVLAQSLGGFNQALLANKQTLQIPIGDPLGFPDYQPVTDDVAAAVGGSRKIAPQPHNNFNPIRLGALKILQLRLVDTFGQAQRLTPKGGRVITTETMTTPESPDLTMLNPRLVQPARLNFRWLDANANPWPLPVPAIDGEAALQAEQSLAETNSHPATTPVCGWLLPNILDGSLIFYNKDGQALGSLAKDATWSPAPGPLQPRIQDLPEALRKLVTYLVQQQEIRNSQNSEQTFLSDFWQSLENALDNIASEKEAHDEGLAKLISRPIAVVRAFLNLELLGLPAVEQRWEAFDGMVNAVLQGQSPAQPTANFTQVKFPIRIGEYEQLNDGLIGFLIETQDGYDQNLFYAPQTDFPNSATIHQSIAIHRQGQPANISQSIDDPPQILTMLVDPHGSVHATSGILPTKVIDIPPAYYAETLADLEVSFLAAPILTPKGQVVASLPDEPGHTWSWLDRENGQWEIHPIEPEDGKADFTALELREGWFKLGHKSDD